MRDGDGFAAPETWKMRPDLAGPSNFDRLGLDLPDSDRLWLAWPASSSPTSLVCSLQMCLCSTKPVLSPPPAGHPGR